jgi:hypothetical protein
MMTQRKRSLAPSLLFKRCSGAADAKAQIVAEIVAAAIRTMEAICTLMIRFSGVGTSLRDMKMIAAVIAI